MGGLRIATVALLAALGLACSSSAPNPRPTPSPDPVEGFAPGTTWQWQLQGPIDTSFEVQVYDLDLFNVPLETIQQLQAAGRAVICYFSAGSWEPFRSDADQFPASVLGNPLDGFEEERWLDIRQIDALAPVMAARLDLAVSKGCDGVEPDNADGYLNDTGFPLSGEDQLAYNRFIAGQARARGLAVGLKNDLDQIPELVGAYDFAVNEQCFEFDECERLLPFVEAGKAVFGVEYNLPATAFCAQANAMGFSWLKKDLDLTASVEFCLP